MPAKTNFAHMLRASFPFLADLLRILVLLAFYTILRVVFIDHYSEVKPDDMSRILWGGLRFDLWSIAWLSTPYLLLRLFVRSEEGWVGYLMRALFVVPNIGGLFMACLDLEYFAFSKQRTTADYFDIATGGGEIWAHIPDMFPDFLLSLLLFGIMSVLLVSANRKIGYMLYPERSPIVGRLLFSIVMLALLLIAQRGGFQLKPINGLAAGQYTVPERYAMVLNTPFTILQSLGKHHVQPVEYLPANEADALWPVQHQLVKDPADLNGYNVVIIIMESFSAELSGLLSSNRSKMPFLDSLMARSIYFERAYANGTRSIDALPAIISSIPPLAGNAFITSPYATTKHTSLANVLSGKGYSTSFFHGGKTGTMGFSDYSKTAGFHRYVGLEDYKGDGIIGNWGVHDKPFLEFHANEMASTPEPFFSTIFSLSSHHPYDVPELEEITVSSYPDPLERSIRYADRSLQHYFDLIKGSDWYPKTMFIITADHTAENKSSDRPLDEKYRVPLIVHLPEKNVAFRSPKVVQHLDILPMTLDFLGHETSFFSFGQDLRGQKEGSAVFREGDLFHLMSNEGSVTFDGAQVIQSKDRSSAKQPLPTATTTRYVRRLKACIQQFNDHVSKRRLTVE